MPTAPVTAPAGLEPFETAEASMPITISRVPTAAAAISAAAAHELRRTGSQPAVHTAPRTAAPPTNCSQRAAWARSLEAPREDDGSVASDASRNAVPSTNTTAPATRRATGVKDLMICSNMFPHRMLPWPRYSGGTRFPCLYPEAGPFARECGEDRSHPGSVRNDLSLIHPECDAGCVNEDRRRGGSDDDWARRDVDGQPSRR